MLQQCMTRAPTLTHPRIMTCNDSFLYYTAMYKSLHINMQLLASVKPYLYVYIYPCLYNNCLIINAYAYIIVLT